MAVTIGIALCGLGKKFAKLKGENSGISFTLNLGRIRNIFYPTAVMSARKCLYTSSICYLFSRQEGEKKNFFLREKKMPSPPPLPFLYNEILGKSGIFVFQGFYFSSRLWHFSSSVLVILVFPPFKRCALETAQVQHLGTIPVKRGVEKSKLYPLPMHKIMSPWRLPLLLWQVIEKQTYMSPRGFTIVEGWVLLLTAGVQDSEICFHRCQKDIPLCVFKDWHSHCNRVAPLALGLVFCRNVNAGRKLSSKHVYEGDLARLFWEKVLVGLGQRKC